MLGKPESFESDLNAFRAKYPNVWMEITSPSDIFALFDTLPENWNDPIYTDIKQRLEANYDSEFGTSFVDLQEQVSHAVEAAAENKA